MKLTTTTTYTAAGRTGTATDPSGYATAYHYDGAGRLDRVTAPGGRATTYAYDENGQVVLAEQRDPVTDGVLAATATVYDAVGRVTHSIVDPDRTPYTGLKLDTASAYDRAGRLTGSTTPNGFTTQYAYDGASRLWKITDAASPQGTVTLRYDDAGRPSSVENARGSTTTYAYALSTVTGLGWITTVTDPLLRTSTTTANLAGQTAVVADGNGNALHDGYDSAGRLTRIYDPAFVGTVGDYVTYNRDGLGRTTSVANANGSVGYAYDPAGRVGSVSSPQGTVGYTYEANGRRATMTLPAVGGGSPRVVTYGYDPATDDLASVTDWTAATTDFTYDGRGLPYQVLRPNGITTTYGYDAALRLTGISHFGTNTGTYLAEYGYQYDRDGNRTRLDVTGSAVTNGYETYGYDELDRLTDYRDLGGNTFAYAYDANGNRTSIDDGLTMTAYGYDAADQLQTVDGTDLFAYDGNGNRIAFGTNTYSWDWANRLTGATVAGTSASYAYLGDGSRAAKTVGSSTTSALWDRAGGLPHLLDDGTTSAVRAGGLTAEVDDAGNDHAWDLPDALGSVRAQVDDSASITATAEWDAWGNATAGGTGLFGWDGEQADAETGLTFLRARYYSPVFGQFVSRDPLMSGSGTQRSAYAFANDNPATLGDPSGLSPSGGLAGLGRSIANAFWLLAYALECGVVGECRYRRRHAASPAGELPDPTGSEPPVVVGVGTTSLGADATVRRRAAAYAKDPYAAIPDVGDNAILACKQNELTDWSNRTGWTGVWNGWDGEGPTELWLNACYSSALAKNLRKQEGGTLSQSFLLLLSVAVGWAAGAMGGVVTAFLQYLTFNQLSSWADLLDLYREDGRGNQFGTVSRLGFLTKYLFNTPTVRQQQPGEHPTDDWFEQERKRQQDILDNDWYHIHCEPTDPRVYPDPACFDLYG